MRSNSAEFSLTARMFGTMLIIVTTVAGHVRAQFTEPETTVIHTFTGEVAGDQFGWVSEDIGDITSDGVHDLIITAPGHDTGGANRGRAYVYNGATGALVFPPITGTVNNASFGGSVGAPGDVNGDGVRDMIIASTAYQSSRGRAAIHSGADGSEIHAVIGAALGDQFGYDCAGVGDLDGDLRGDFIVGAPGHDTAGGNAGRAYVFSGATASLICTIDGASAADRFGSGVHAAPDVTGDGIPDLLVAAESYAAGAAAGTGRAYVYSGAGCLAGNNPAPIRLLSPPAPAALFGQWFVDGSGDVDNDGFYDFYVSDYNANRAHVFSGATGARIRTYMGNNEGGFGIGRMAGDVDQDGWEDMLLAAWFSPAGATQAGKAFVYSGRTSAVLQTYTHNVAFAQLGFDANAMGDVNGDGRVDYLLTAANDNGATGRAYLVAGNIDPYHPADLNLDGNADFADYNLLTACLAGPAALQPENCERADMSNDGRVDLRDFAKFQQVFIEP